MSSSFRSDSKAHINARLRFVRAPSVGISQPTLSSRWVRSQKPLMWASWPAESASLKTTAARGSVSDWLRWNGVQPPTAEHQSSWTEERLGPGSVIGAVARQRRVLTALRLGAGRLQERSALELTEAHGLKELEGGLDLAAAEVRGLRVRPRTHALATPN